MIPSRDQATAQDTELWKSLENKDLYKVLGVSTDASTKDIERAFRRKARDVHPDKHSDVLSTERFKELTTAKDLLLDVEQRWWYDQRRQMEADVVARVLEEAKLRAKAKESERSQQLAADDEKFAEFVDQAQTQSTPRAEADSDDDCPGENGKLRASAKEFVPAAGAAHYPNQVVEVFSQSSQKWCPGIVLEVSSLPGGRSALTVRYQVSHVQWNEKMLYDEDPNLRIIEKGKMRATAPDFVPSAHAPSSNLPRPDLLPATVPFVPRGVPSPPAPALQLQVTVPAGASGGQMINIVTESGRPLTLQVPQGLFPGQVFIATIQAPAAPCVARQLAPHSPQIAVTVPAGASGGQQINIVTASGQTLTVCVPQGLQPGQTFQCAAPPVVTPSPAPPQQMQVTVPVGASGGQEINIITETGFPMVVSVPPGLQSGQTFLCAVAPRRP